MTTSQQDEGIYSVPLIQYGSDSASASGEQLAGTSSGELSGSSPHARSGVYCGLADMFVVGFPMAPLTCDPSDYSNYGWATGGSGTYEATPATCEPPSKSEGSEGEGALLLLMMIGICNAYAR